MKNGPSLESAEIYLNLQLTRLGRSHPALAQLPFVTISRECGAGATSLALALASELNLAGASDPPWTVFDGNLLEAMLEANHYPQRLAQYLPEDSVSELAASVGEIVGLHPNLWDLTLQANEFIRRLGRMGHCILIGRGSNLVTAGIPLGTHVRLIGSPERRAASIARARGMSIEEAHEYIRSTDAARRRYVQRLFDCAIDDPREYDVVINTDRVANSEAIRFLANLVHTMEDISMHVPL